MITKVEKKLIKWLAESDNTGISSKAIAFYMLGFKYKYADTPSDPSDFNRCLQLLKAIPEIKPRLKEMSKIGADWSTLINNWDQLERLFIAEAGDNWCKNDSAPKTYKMMKDMGL